MSSRVHRADGWVRRRVRRLSVRTLSSVDPTTAASLGVIAGLGLGGVALAAVRLSDRAARRGSMTPTAPVLPPGVGEVLAVLRSSGIVVDPSERVVNNSAAAVSHGLVRGQELVHPQLRAMARDVRRTGEIREAELELRRGLGEGLLVVSARVAPLGSEHVLLLVEDRSQAHRVEQVRRDFLANVSHELKTPVGGISLLAEAVLGAHDDPEAVARFAKRIGVESTRLTHLVKDIVELSRLEVADVVSSPEVVDAGACATEAIERYRLIAQEHDVELVVSADDACLVWGEAELVTTAVGNLVGNAIAYCERGSQVGVSVRRSPEQRVEIAVTDQGVGVAEDQQELIFQRFYRIDPARSRATGGTGLGLAIVKHITTNLGGQVSVWSQPGQGSTFTITLPTVAPSRTTRHAGSLAPPDGLVPTDLSAATVVADAADDGPGAPVAPSTTDSLPTP